MLSVGIMRVRVIMTGCHEFIYTRLADDVTAWFSYCGWLALRAF
jgi:hypothetical protein